MFDGGVCPVRAAIVCLAVGQNLTSALVLGVSQARDVAAGADHVHQAAFFAGDAAADSVTYSPCDRCGGTGRPGRDPRWDSASALSLGLGSASGSRYP